MVDPARRNISLVLGGGGARGHAHIGVIRALEEHGFSIRSIAGCSMGALVGGIYAMGRLEEYEAWARRIDRRQIFSLLDLSFGGGGLVKGERVIAALRGLVGEMQIEELPIRFTAVAADIVRGREVWIDRGPLFDAIRASISLPLFFTPADHQGVRLVDGGVFDPVPIAATYRDGTDLTIAVSLSGPPSRQPSDPPVSEQVEEPSGFSARLWRRLPGRGERNGKGEKAERSEEPWDLSFVVSQSIDAMQGVITRQRLAAHPPDVLIEIPRDACGVLEFERAAELIALGHELARARVAGL
jgi:NTE family protein